MLFRFLDSSFPVLRWVLERIVLVIYVWFFGGVGSRNDSYSDCDRSDGTQRFTGFTRRFLVHETIAKQPRYATLRVVVPIAMELREPLPVASHR